MYNSPIAVLRGLRTEFYKQLSEAQDSQFKPFTFVTKSDGSYEDYGFFDAMPAIKEWLDEIDFKDFKDYKYQILNKDWANGILVDKNTINDSKKILGGNIELQIKSAVDQWKYFMDELIYSLLIANGTAFDGSAFFATSHNISAAAAIDNLKSGSGTTLANIETDISTARTAMLSYKSANGRLYNMNAKLAVLTPVQLLDKFLTLQTSETIYDGSGNKTNIYKGTFDIIINQRQAITDNDWYLINTNASIPPFIYQEREAPFWDYKEEKDNKKIKYFATARSNAGYGNFTAMLKVNNS